MIINYECAVKLSLLGKFNIFLKTLLNSIRDKYVFWRPDKVECIISMWNENPHKFFMEALPFEILYRVLHFVGVLKLIIT